MAKLLIIFTALLFTATPLLAQDETKVSGFVDFNFYAYDTRDATTFTIGTLLNLPQNFSYFGFVNYASPLNTSTQEELENFYTEQALMWQLPYNLPFTLNTQWVIASGPSSDALRFGVGWLVSSTPIVGAFLKNLHLFYKVNFFPLQIDSLAGFNWQIEHVYGMLVLPNLTAKRLYISGFADHNLGPNGSAFVIETQAGLRIIDQLFAIAEHRYSDFETEKNGVAFGAEYKVPF